MDVLSWDGTSLSYVRGPVLFLSFFSYHINGKKVIEVNLCIPRYLFFMAHFIESDEGSTSSEAVLVPYTAFNGAIFLHHMKKKMFVAR